MSRVFKKIFCDKEKLNSMIKMRELGWTYVSLALYFGVDHSSIYHECKKYHVMKKGDISFNPLTIVSDHNLFVRKPKTYAEYLAEDKNKKLRFPNYIQNK